MRDRRNGPSARMAQRHATLRIAILLLLALTAGNDSRAQLPTDDEQLPQSVGNAAAASEDSLTTLAESLAAAAPTRQKRDWATWHPKPQRALWLALVLPGAGQVYNRKYWKLPIFYGGFIGCIYSMRWNNMMYKDYSQAYLDLMDDNPQTQSYNQFLHLGRQITSDNAERYKRLFKSRKDRYRRWRDMAFFVMIGVYALSVIDAYVDAELSEFDISKDLSMKVKPTVVNSNSWLCTQNNPVKSTAVGLQCSLNF